MFNGIAVFPTAPCTSFLALKLELFLSLGVCESKEELDAIVFTQNAVEVSDDMLSNLACVKARRSQ